MQQNSGDNAESKNPSTNTIPFTSRSEIDHVPGHSTSSFTADASEKEKESESQSERVEKKVSVDKNLTKDEEKLKRTKNFRSDAILFLFLIFVRKRSKLYLLFEVLVPGALVCAIIAAFTSGISWKQADAQKIAFAKSMTGNSAKYKAFDVSIPDAIKAFKLAYTSQEDVEMYFFPDNKVTTAIMKEALGILALNQTNNVRFARSKGVRHGAFGMRTVDDAVRRTQIGCRKKGIHPIAIIFHGTEKKLDPITNFPYDLSFSIRHCDEDISNTFEKFPHVPRRTSKGREEKRSAYVRTGFIGLQYAIEYGYFRKLAEILVVKDDDDPLLTKPETKRSAILHNIDTEIPVLRLKSFDVPNFCNMRLRKDATFSTCCCLVVAYLFTYFFVKQIINESKTFVKQKLIENGYATSWHWLILFLHSLAYRGLAVLLVTIMFFIDFGHGTILSRSNKFLTFFLLLQHALAVVAFDFYISAFIKSVFLTGMTQGLIGFLSFAIPVTMSVTGLLWDVGNVLIALLFPNWTLFNILFNMVNWECSEKGLSGRNLGKRAVESAIFFPVSSGMIILLVSTTVYFFGTILIEWRIAKKVAPESILAEGEQALKPTKKEEDLNNVFKHEMSLCGRKMRRIISHCTLPLFAIPLAFIFILTLEAAVRLANPTPKPPLKLSYETFKDSDLTVFFKVQNDIRSINYASRITSIVGKGRAKLVPRGKHLMSHLIQVIHAPASDDILGYNKETHMTALEFQRDFLIDTKRNFDGTFSNGALHSGPTVLNAMINVLLSTLTEVGAKPYRIDCINHPLPNLPVKDTLSTFS